MSLSVNGHVQSPEHLGHSQPGTQARDGASVSAASSPFIGSRFVVDLDVQAPPEVVSQPAPSGRVCIGQVSCLGASANVAGILTKTRYGECQQLRGTGAQDRSNESRIAGEQCRDESITEISGKRNGETVESLVSVRDDILFEIRSLKFALFQELQSVRNDAACFQSKSLISSPPYHISGSPVPSSISVPQERRNSKKSHNSDWTSISIMMPDPPERIGATQETRNSKRSQQSDGISSRPSSSALHKSTARLHDEAILEDLRQRHRSFHCFGHQPSNHTSSEYIKENVRKSYLQRNTYDFSKIYHRTGLFQKVARHDVFEYVTLAVIVVNAIWMSVDADLNNADSIAKAGFMYVLADVMFYTYFVGEILIRFLAFKHKCLFYKDRWFVFDLVLVILYTFDPFVIAIVRHVVGSGSGGGGLSTEGLRLLRLLRLFRLTRLLRFFPEMLIMIKGLGTALATVGYTLGLLALVTYVFAIALRNTVPADSQIEIQYFPTIFESMHNLLLYGTFVDNLAQFILLVKEDSVACFVLSWLYICLAHLLIMNVLIGILCEVMAQVAADEKEHMTVSKINDTFRKLLSNCAGNKDGHVEWEEFAQLLDTDSCLDALKKFDVDVDALVDMVEDQFFSSDSGEKISITFAQVIELIVELRGAKAASVKDVMVIGKRLNTKVRELKEILAVFESLCHESFRSSKI